ncbi:DUF4351 domain-containing protein [Methylotuvimicrobium alcaliphilum]|uniref:DUF4351 domain-containing protein n=1 Tax=Methylotuvimicrobium alcaliphilum (strain DSM 19304 / NCIMB 14124 / VKM B-2133 / 20Z) TaxID=1091494 RepID=G4SUP2_META2|nr:DUF4351 domain-containing protein [Methylotuvimicrobium alcaliphilum]CCE22869.1 conserved protein of unknown function [Methylotuvimicrobium alcaliphilum 20Z]
MGIAQLLRQEGREEGHEEGRKSECMALINRQLRRKLGLQPTLEQLLSKLPALSLETLEDLADALLDFQELNDLQAWLDEHGG